MKNIELKVTGKAIKKIKIEFLEYFIVMVLIGAFFITNLDKANISKGRLVFEAIIIITNVGLMIESILKLINIRNRAYVKIVNDEIVIMKYCISSESIKISEVNDCKVTAKNLELVDKSGKCFKIEIDKLSLEDNKILKDSILGVSFINIQFEKGVEVWAKQS